MQFTTNRRTNRVFLFDEFAGWRVRLAPGTDSGCKLLTKTLSLLTLAMIVIGSSSFTSPTPATAQDRATTNEY